MSIDTLDGILQSDKQIRIAQAKKIRLVAQLAAEAGEYADVELSLALRVPPAAAAALVYSCRRIAFRLSRTLAMLEAGDIDYARVLAIHEATDDCTDEVAAVVEETVLAKAPERTSAQVRRAARDTVIRKDPEGYAARHQERLKKRNVSIYDVDDGMVAVRAELSAEVGQACYTKIDLLASQVRDPSRSKDEIRADVLADLILNGPQDSGPRPLIQITMPLSTLVGYNDDPCELDSYGLIPAEVAREMAAEPGSVWHRLVTDPVGEQLLDYGTRTYRPPAGLDRFVRTRDKTCVHPGCRRSARRCHLDHTVPFPDGPTSAGNLKPRCLRHHLFKHLPGVVVVQNDDGTTTLTTPLGRTYVEDTAPF